MNGSLRATTSCSCPTCDAFTVAMPSGRGDYCPSCLTIVTQLRGVKLVQPHAFRQDLRAH
jgi:hypothetical protein